MTISTFIYEYEYMIIKNIFIILQKEIHFAKIEIKKTKK